MKHFAHYETSLILLGVDQLVSAVTHLRACPLRQHVISFVLGTFVTLLMPYRLK